MAFRPRLLAWDDLRHLLAVERAGSLAAAAHTLGVDQTTVGRRLTALQRACGAQLVERGTAGSRLTAAGRRACAVARRMEESALALDGEVGADDDTLAGDVRLSVPESFARMMARALAELHAVHPAIRVELLIGSDVNLVRRDADFALRMMLTRQASLLTKKLASAPWGVFASDRYLARRGAPPPSSSWAGHDVIGYLDPLARAPGPRWLDVQGGDARVAFRTNNALAAVAAAAEGIGIVAAPSFIAATEPRLRAVVSRSVGAGTVYLMAHRERARVPRVRTAIDAVTHWFRSRFAA